MEEEDCTPRLLDHSASAGYPRNVLVTMLSSDHRGISRYHWYRNIEQWADGLSMDAVVLFHMEAFAESLVSFLPQRDEHVPRLPFPFIVVALGKIK